MLDYPFDTHTLVTAFAALLAVSVPLHIRNRNSFNAASARFRAAFVDTRTLLRHSKSDVVSILQPVFPSHEAAVFEFVQHLSFISRGRFIRKWRDYYYLHGHSFLEQYSPFVATINGLAPRHERRALAIHRIEAMLAYAKP